jgi:hypothetical protein
MRLSTLLDNARRSFRRAFPPPTLRLDAVKYRSALVGIDRSDDIVDLGLLLVDQLLGLESLADQSARPLEIFHLGDQSGVVSFFWACARSPRNRYLGTIDGSPPGVPGGGITGVLPPLTGGAAIPGSTPAGG